MTMRLTWQGSEVRQIEVASDTVRVRFSAASAVHVGGAPSGRDVEGFLRPLAVVFTRARLQGDLDSALGTLSDSVLHHTGHTYRELALPFILSGGAQAELVFRNGTVLQIDADAVSCTPDANSQFFESMAC